MRVIEIQVPNFKEKCEIVKRIMLDEIKNENCA